ncbi:bacteriohemerythrin [Maridesulfovibrio hydrothermalis]|uniref:Methyl-accepting chemotaxis sensory transducer n=1 Tax=Maridesulfovibrio hydrothermalis AM13 = DSM 14728 TaxID=1121451 RepID=L0RIT0_9BACT|nr:bacteriohemerythrin [Maridesulfovibrio hydrothermalis]CCO25481.1 Methyl-accepting chemotaxis sensory transducer [Maridesulfovibrio hydrothermalis AM13 = DSM 14728]
MNISTRLKFSVVLLGLIPVLLALIIWFICPELTRTGNVTTVLVSSTVFSLIVAGLVFFSIRRDLTTPMKKLGQYAVSIQKGKRMNACDGNFKYELLELKEAICAMVDGLEEASENAKALRREAEIKALESENALKSSREKEEETNKLITSMRKVADKATESSVRIFSNLNELTERIESVSEGVDIQRDRMTETATAMEEMNSTVFEVARNASLAAGNAEESKSKASTGAKGVSESVEAIRKVEKEVLSLKETMAQLGDRAVNIGNVIDVINDIADQTNLLALNAAIEAARAGEAGRGFAVVADEVRKLAEKTMVATKEVGDAINDIQSHAHTNVASVERAAADIVSGTETAVESGRYMHQIVAIIDSTSEQVDSIATASEEQSATSEEINSAVSDVTRVAQETAEGMEQARHVLIEVSGLVQELDSLIHGMATGNLDGASGKELVTWSDSAYSVGVRTIDVQHKKLVGMINALHKAMRDRASGSVMQELVDKLKNYTVEHFRTEEQLFDKFGYPHTAEHKVLHEKFVNQVLEFDSALRSGKAKVTMEVMHFLKDWLIQHIQGEDRKYTSFMNSNGVR